MYRRDGSAAATINFDGSWMFERKLKENEDEYTMRNNQVSQRVDECEKTFQLLNSHSVTLQVDTAQFFH